MSPVFPLQPLLDLSQMRLDQAARELGELIAGEQEATKRLALLLQYREEYHARFMAAAASGIGQSEWSNYSRFLARIDDAIVPAAQSVEATRQRTLMGQQDWMGKHGKVRAFNTLADRHRARAAGEEARGEQKNSDEHGARRHAENGTGQNLFQLFSTAIPAV